MYKNIMLTVLSVVLFTSLCFSGELPVNNHPATDAYPGWKLGAQAFTFKEFTFFQALEKIDAAGLDWVEMYPGQTLSVDQPDVKTSWDMTPENRQLIKDKLNELGLRLTNYGVVRPKDEADWRQVFEFAKDMGISTIVSEPEEDAIPMIDKMCQEYKIQVAIHNHPDPSHYWNPETVLKVCKGRSKWIGAMGDTGHWMRSGIDPIDAIKELGDRLLCLHFKDLNEFGNKKAHDVPWGTGAANAKAILELLNKQGFKGAFSIEYEYNWKNSLPEVRQCVEWFNHTAMELKSTGWDYMLNDDLSNAIFKEGSWTVEDGELTWHGGSYIWTKAEYGDFILDLEYKVSEGANSGVFFRTSDLDDIVNTGIEVQIHETTDGSKYGMCGAVYDIMPPKVQNQHKAGEWNHFTITCKDNMIWVVQNGQQIIDLDLNKWTEAGKNPDGTDNKFKYAYKDLKRKGHIGLQDHGQPVWFRNMRIKAL